MIWIYCLKICKKQGEIYIVHPAVSKFVCKTA